MMLSLFFHKSASSIILLDWNVLIKWFYWLCWAGERLIGQITFDILLNISYSDLEPHITELAKLIADGLSIKTSQVR